MDIQYFSYSEKSIHPRQLMFLYQDADWWEERQEQAIFQMLQSGTSIGAWINDQLIGFIRSVSDGHFRAYIEDVVVHHEFHRHGVGQRLVKNMLDHLQHIDVISLFCEEHLIDFYQAQGFKKSRSQYVLHKKVNQG